MPKPKMTESYSPEDYRGFINLLLDRIDDVRLLRKILDFVNRLFCEN